MSDPVELANARAQLGKKLKQLRLDAGLSGAEAGRRAAMSQSKVSRIETGRDQATVVDVQRLLNALGVPADQQRLLLRLATLAARAYRSHREDYLKGPLTMQQRLMALEQSSRLIRDFLPHGIPGLYQTEEYVRALLTAERPEATDIQSVINAKMQRQQLLTDTDREFRALFTLSALQWPVVDAALMREQYAKLSATAARPNVTARVIDPDITVPVVPTHPFLVYDSRLVTVEMFTGKFAFHDPRDIRHYENLYAYYWARSVDVREIIGEQP